MPISVKWHNTDKTILHYEFTGTWTINEIWELFNTDVLEYLSETSHVPDSIVTFNSSKFAPTGLLSFWRRAYQWMQDNGVATSIVALVNVPPAVRGIGDTLRRLRVPVMHYMFFVDSVEEGLKLIDTLRADSSRKRLTDD